MMQETTQNSNNNTLNEEDQAGIIENPVYEITKIIAEWREKND